MSSRPASRHLVIGAIACAIAAVGCEDFSRFSTASGEAYCGSVTLGSEFREGLSPRMQMSLTLDASHLDGPASPGQITTFEAASGGAPAVKMFDAAPLRVIAPLEHDVLSHLDLGAGRDRSAIYALSPAHPKDPSMIAVLSLKHDDSVEIRLLRAGRATSEADPVKAGDETVFGIFPLVRRIGGCGF